MNRRDFVSRVALGAGAVCTGFGRPTQAASPTNRVNVRFVGMMTFMERWDHSFLVATPGQHALHHMMHTPFLMARRGSAIAHAFGMTPAAGVVPEAFDTTLIGTNPSDFVYRNLENTALDIVSGAQDKVVNNADQMASLNRIAPKKRVRGNIEKWASSTVSLRGGRIENAPGHPDAGKVWSFGSYKQRLTDAVNFHNVNAVATAMRLTSASEARSFIADSTQSTELWVISAAQPGSTAGEPSMLEHSEVLFDYLVDATPVAATCPDATGRLAPATELPFARATSASGGMIGSSAAMPPWTELCFIAEILVGNNQ